MIRSIIFYKSLSLQWTRGKTKPNLSRCVTVEEPEGLPGEGSTLVGLLGVEVEVTREQRTCTCLQDGKGKLRELTDGPSPLLSWGGGVGQ